MLNTLVNPEGDFTPPLRFPENVLTREQVLCHHHAQCRVSKGGRGNDPSVIVPVLCISYHGTGNPPKSKNQNILCQGIHNRHRIQPKRW